MSQQQQEIIEWEWLWLRCRRGDAKALECLIRELERPLFYFIRRIIRNEADAWDVLQQTWIRVCAGIGSVRGASTLKAWIYRTARNTALNHIRADRRYREIVEDKGEMTIESESDPTSFEDSEEVHRALDELELPYREALTLYFLEQLSVRELAEVLEIPEGTVKSRLYHGRRQLREILENKHGKQS